MQSMNGLKLPTSEFCRNPDFNLPILCPLPFFSLLLSLLPLSTFLISRNIHKFLGSSRLYPPPHSALQGCGFHNKDLIHVQPLGHLSRTMLPSSLANVKVLRENHRHFKVGIPSPSPAHVSKPQRRESLSWTR